MLNLKTAFIAILAATVADSSANAAWVNLFNGKNLAGWTQKTGNATYFVEDGCLVGQMNIPGSGTNSFLCTTKDYDNFVLELDFIADPRLNSGIQIRSEISDTPRAVAWRGETINIRPGYVYGYQVEIDTYLKGKTWTGGLYDERRRGEYLVPAVKPEEPAGQAFTKVNRVITSTNGWNHLRIEAVGDSIKTYLNGVLRTDIRDSMTAKGFIGLQVHNGNEKFRDGAQVRFKNIRLQTVSPKKVAAEPEPNTLTAKEKAAGWRLLWDGRTTDGWRSVKRETFPAQGWTIQDGVLTVHDNHGEESAGGGDIITRERFSHFDLLVDFKLTPGANSGIKYFVQPNLDPITGSGAKAATGSAIGLEYQILDDERHPDAKMGRDGDRTLGSLYYLIPAAKSKQPNPIGEWNTARILVKGDRVQYWLNGKPILSYRRGSAAFRKVVAESKYKNLPNFGEWPDGHILLQEHGHEVSFRNIKIRVSQE